MKNLAQHITESFINEAVSNKLTFKEASNSSGNAWIDVFRNKKRFGKIMNIKGEIVLSLDYYDINSRQWNPYRSASSKEYKDSSWNEMNDAKSWLEKNLQTVVSELDSGDLYLDKPSAGNYRDND